MKIETQQALCFSLAYLLILAFALFWAVSTFIRTPAIKKNSDKIKEA